MTAVGGAADVVEALAAAYLWGYPLVAVHRARARAGAQARGPAAATGGLVARPRLSTAVDRSVVAPNNDTLYASGWFDLGAGDVTVEVDRMDPPDRYWSVMLIDAYTDVAYVCRRLHGTGGARVRVTLDPILPPPTTAVEVVPMATRTLWVLARVLVDGPDDLAAARAAQSRIRVHQAGTVRGRPALSARGGAEGRSAAGPGDSGRGRPARPAGARSPGTDAAGRGSGALAAGADPRIADFFADLRDALAIDPPAPWQPPAPAGTADLLADPPTADVRAAGVERGEELLALHGRGVDRHGNGWGTRSRGADFGDDVTYRAAFARYSLAGHLPAENRSYSRLVDGRRCSVLRFPPGGEPPVDAFWSLSLYGPDMFFVDNPLGRFSIGDRTPGLRRDRDGSLSIAVSHTDPGPGANWLPAPAGPCVLALRAYEGHPPVVDATWFPPELTGSSSP